MTTFRKPVKDIFALVNVRKNRVWNFGKIPYESYWSLLNKTCLTFTSGVSHSTSRVVKMATLSSLVVPVAVRETSFTTSNNKVVIMTTFDYQRLQTRIFLKLYATICICKKTNWDEHNTCFRVQWYPNNDPKIFDSTFCHMCELLDDTVLLPIVMKIIRAFCVFCYGLLRVDIIKRQSNTAESYILPQSSTFITILRK